MHTGVVGFHTGAASQDVCHVPLTHVAMCRPARLAPCLAGLHMRSVQIEPLGCCTAHSRLPSAWRHYVSPVVCREHATRFPSDGGTLEVHLWCGLGPALWPGMAPMPVLLGHVALAARLNLQVW